MDSEIVGIFLFSFLVTTVLLMLAYSIEQDRHR